MRLAPSEIDAIKTAARAAFGDAVVVRLFGSRVHDRLKGGDVDLHFEVSGDRPAFEQQCRFLDLVEGPLDGRKVDTLFSVRGFRPEPFEAIAYRDGVVL